MMESMLGNKSPTDLSTPGRMVPKIDKFYVDFFLDKNSYPYTYDVSFEEIDGISSGLSMVELDFDTYEYIKYSKIEELVNKANSYQNNKNINSVDFDSKDRDYYGLIKADNKDVVVKISEPEKAIVIIDSTIIQEEYSLIKLDKDKFYQIRIIGNKGNVKIERADFYSYKLKGKSNDN